MLQAMFFLSFAIMLASDNPTQIKVALLGFVVSGLVLLGKFILNYLDDKNPG